MKVLFISQWYPHRYDKMAGLFVQKHAEAAALFCEISVLYVHPDENITKFEIVKQQYNAITEYIVYYPFQKHNSFDKFKKVINYLQAYRKGFNELKKDNFDFDLIHSTILTRTPTIAYLYFLFHKIPYVITEHWSRYLPERNQFNGFFRKLTARFVVKKAKAILPVSENLKKNMLRYKLENNNYHIVNNVVDNYFFEKIGSQPRKKKRIIHISCFDETAKNMKGLLRAIKEVSLKRDDFDLQIIGSGVDYQVITEYANSINLSKETVEFLGELSPNEVAYHLMNADFSCLFSNYENVPVVISESLVCGKPVIATKVGGISEHINDSNGILIPPRDEKALAEALDYMLDHFQDYDSISIMQKASEMYSYEKVGSQLFNIYKEIV